MGSGMIGKRSLAFVGMVAGGLAGVLGAYISLAANDMLSSSQLWAAATAGAITGLLLGILMTCILTSCNPVKMLKGLQAAGAGSRRVLGAGRFFGEDMVVNERHTFDATALTFLDTRHAVN